MDGLTMLAQGDQQIHHALLLAAAGSIRGGTFLPGRRNPAFGLEAESPNSESGCWTPRVVCGICALDWMFRSSWMIGICLLYGTS